MFKAYFLLSMELVRDLVKSLEQEMMANFNDGDAEKPVRRCASLVTPKKEEARAKPSFCILGRVNLARLWSDA